MIKKHKSLKLNKRACYEDIFISNFDLLIKKANLFEICFCLILTDLRI